MNTVPLIPISNATADIAAPQSSSSQNESSFAPELSQAISDKQSNKKTENAGSSSDSGTSLTEQPSLIEQPQDLSLSGGISSLPKATDAAILPDIGQILQENDESLQETETGADIYLSRNGEKNQLQINAFPQVKANLENQFLKLAETNTTDKSSGQSLSNSFNNTAGVKIDGKESVILDIPLQKVTFQSEASIAQALPSTRSINVSTQDISITTGPKIDFTQHQVQQKTVNLALNNEGDSIVWQRTQNTASNNFIQGRNAYFSPVVIQAEGGAKISSISTESIMASLADLSTEKTAVRQQLSPIRQEISNQFIDAKLQQQETQSDSDLKNNGQETQNKNSNNTQTANPYESTMKAPSSLSEQNSTHSFSQSFFEKSSQTVMDTGRPSLPVFTSQTMEDNVIQQLSAKLRTNQILNDGKLIVRLSPAELGQLKIDIQIKDGSITASILAQSHKVQDILEKNMPKLRVLLEENGLKVQDIIVKIDGETTHQFNTFEEHLSQDDKDFSRKHTSKTHFVLDSSEDETELSAPSAAAVNIDSGVNLTI